MAYQQLPKMQPNVAVEPIIEGYNSPSPVHQRSEEDDRNFEFDHASPVSTVGTRNVKHMAHWSSSSNTATVISETSSQRSNGKARSSHARSWAFEMMAIVVALGAVASIIGVVFKYNGRALPDWPHDITLNALIALLATCANATMSVCLSSGISQAKWIRFKQTPTPLSDIEAFDEASRGSWGALKLLVTAKGG
jgi:hypothetical protein